MLCTGTEAIVHAWLCNFFCFKDEDGSAEEMRYLWSCETVDPPGGPCIDHSNATLLELANADLEDEIYPPEIQLPVVPIQGGPTLTIPAGKLADTSEEDQHTGTLNVARCFERIASALVTAVCDCRRC